ncbi:Cytochrome P [Parasponia andersonii]|uniref:Cytochrome P n=1 Tax=Parasponia andersonii TaxID=3476 RepID=A0A2P5B7X7_PARAD|nr:Cytochrome P [Parasponia andersonii]
MGVYKTLIINGAKIAKDRYTANGQVFTNRAKAMVLEVMGYNYAMFRFGNYELYWCRLRKSCSLTTVFRHSVSPGIGALNMVLKMVVGKRFFGARDISSTIRGMFDFEGYKKAMKKTAKKLDHVLEEWLEEHKRKRSNDSGQVMNIDHDQQRDLMSVMLSILYEDGTEEFSSHDADTIIKATCVLSAAFHRIASINNC